MSEKIELREYLPIKAKEFILGMYPKLNIKCVSKNKIQSFLGNNDYDEYRSVRDHLIANKLIVLRSGNNEDSNEYVLEPKGVDYIKQENKDWRNNHF